MQKKKKPFRQRKGCSDKGCRHFSYLRKRKIGSTLPPDSVRMPFRRNSNTGGKKGGHLTAFAGVAPPMTGLMILLLRAENCRLNFRCGALYIEKQQRWLLKSVAHHWYDLRGWKIARSTLPEFHICAVSHRTLRWKKKGGNIKVFTCIGYSSETIEWHWHLDSVSVPFRQNYAFSRQDKRGTNNTTSKSWKLLGWLLLLIQCRCHLYRKAWEENGRALPGNVKRTTDR